MKVLVVSDSHGDRDILTALIKEYQDKVDGLFHCGDSELEATDTVWDVFKTVQGNMDFDPDLPLSQTVDIGNERIFMIHGHQHQVKMTMEPLLTAASEAGASFAFFGHSHELGTEMQEGIVLLNPGSILLPRGKYPIPTYAIVETEGKEVNITYYNRRFDPVPGLQAHFTRS